jgi:hypothetical protein
LELESKLINLGLNQRYFHKNRVSEGSAYTFLKKNKSIISDDYSVSFSMEKVNFHNKVGRSKK